MGHAIPRRGQVFGKSVLTEALTFVNAVVNVDGGDEPALNVDPTLTQVLQHG